MNYVIFNVYDIIMIDIIFSEVNINNIIVINIRVVYTVVKPPAEYE